MPTITTVVIGINYRTDEHAVRFAQSLARYSTKDVVVILVDNSERADADAFSRRIHDANPTILHLKAPRNLGYFGGANYGFNWHLKKSELPDWVIVCNVDIEFRDDKFFSTLANLDCRQSVAVVAPLIWSARWKRDLNPKISERPSKEKMRFYKFVFGNFFVQAFYEVLSFIKNSLKAAMRGERTENTKQPNTIKPIYAPHGSCMIFNRCYFTAGGSFEYAVFLFGEEIFVAETVNKLGLVVGHYPSLWVFDNEHASTGIIRSRRVANYMKDATNYLVESYFS